METKKDATLGLEGILAPYGSLSNLPLISKVGGGKSDVSESEPIQSASGVVAE